MEQESVSHVRKFTAGRAAPLDMREHIELAMYTCKLMHGNVERQAAPLPSLVRSLMESGHRDRSWRVATRVVPHTRACWLNQRGIKSSKSATGRVSRALRRGRSALRLWMPVEEAQC